MRSYRPKRSKKSLPGCAIPTRKYKPRESSRGVCVSEVEYGAAQVASRPGSLCLLLFVDVLFILQGALKTPDAFAQPFRQFGNLLSAKQQNSDHQNDQKLG